MADSVSPERRSENMRRIRNKDMKPEMLVRQFVHAMGYRFRLHRRDLPGSPDLVLPRHRKIILVHGCFWHGHGDSNCADGRRLPKTNLDYWIPKLTKNKERDQANIARLHDLGWETMIVWECEIRRLEDVRARLRSFIEMNPNIRQAA